MLQHISNLYKEFPTLNQDDALVYLDSAATSQKPLAVIEALAEHHSQNVANVHRGISHLSAKQTKRYEQARQTVSEFIHSPSERQIVWTKGTTEAINLIAYAYSNNSNSIMADDEILVGEMEHHANLVPWLMLAKRTGAKVIKVPMTADFQWDMNAYQALLSERTKIVAAAHITNVTGTRQPIEQIIALAHQVNAICVIDGAQGIVHESVDVQALDCDFYVFSGHKLYADTGIGVLYAKAQLLESMPPWHGGGKMVQKVSFDDITYAPYPMKFEAGTPNISGAIALKAAIDWLTKIDRAQAHQQVVQLQQYLIEQLQHIPEVKLIALQIPSAMVNFCLVIDGELIHHHDVSTLLSEQGIVARSGHHCAHPLMDKLGIDGTVRLSLGIYNQINDIDRFMVALKKAIDILR